MELYKGEETEDGTINWAAPEPIKKDTRTDRLTRGKSIFETNCASCHHPTKKSTGPALAGVPKHRTKEFLNAFIRNSTGLIASGDPLANCLYDQYNRTAMTAFPYMTDEELNMLYEYLNNEGGKLGAAPLADIQESMDSCKRYFEILHELEYRRQKMIQDNGQPRTQVNYTDATDSDFVVNIPMPDPEEDKVIVQYNEAVYYNVDINAFGWYNIDMLLEKMEGSTPSVLTARVSPDLSPDVYLVVPSHKIFQAGGATKDGDGNFGFYKNDGTIPLPQDVWAYIVAISEQNGNLLLGVQPFKITSRQAISVQMKTVSKEQFEERLSTLGFDGVSTIVSKTKNADSILVIDKELKNLELLRPKNCNCDCMTERRQNNEADTTLYVQ